MATVTETKAITQYFNVDEGKRPVSEFLKELKALSPDEKHELALGVVEITGDKLQ